MIPGTKPCEGEALLFPFLQHINPIQSFFSPLAPAHESLAALSASARFFFCLVLFSIAFKGESLQAASGQEQKRGKMAA